MIVKAALLCASLITFATIAQASTRSSAKPRFSQACRNLHHRRRNLDLIHALT